MRRFAIRLALIALLGVALFVALRSVADGPPPPDVPPARAAAGPALRPPRVHASERSGDPPPRSVRVAVTSMDGTPIPGARLELVRGPARERPADDFRPSVDPPRAEFTAVARDDGAATFEEVPPGRWFVVAAAPGFGRHVLLGTTRDEGDAAVDTSVALEKSSAFAGTILDPDGAPAGGVTVVLSPFSHWPNDAACLRTTAGADGAYRFDAVEPGRYALWYTVRPGFLIEAARLMVPSLDGLDIRMTRGAAIEGVVRDAESGVAVPGARVFGVRHLESKSSADPGSTTVFDVGTADHLGRFALRTWRPQFEVSRLLVDASGYAPTPVEGSGQGPPGAVADEQRFVFDLRLRRAATLKGTLSGPDGPLAGFRVFVRPRDDDEARVPYCGMWESTTGSVGSFLVDRLPAGPARLWFTDDATGWGSTEEREVELLPADAAVHEIRIDVRRVRVTRRVLNTAGDPVEGAEVLQRFGRLRAEARTDADGRFTMDALFEGSWSIVEVRSGRIRGTAMLDSDDEDGATLGLTPIPAAPWVVGTLLRSDETPVAGERLGLVAGHEGIHDFDVRWGGLAESVSAADGTFRMPLTSGPDFFVTVRRLGWLDQERDEDGSIRVELPDAVHAAGLVVDSEGGEPVAGALVRNEWELVVARTGADGRFEFASPPGFRDDPLHVARAGCVLMCVVSGADDQPIRLGRAPAVAGHVRHPDGSAASGLRVVVRSSDDTRDETPWTSTSATDADGRFVVPGLAAGPCVVTVTDPVDFAFATVRKTATVGDEAVVFVVRPGARLIVQVLDEAGEHVAAALVTAHPSNADLADDEARTPYRGTVTFGLASNEPYTLRIEHDDFAAAEVPNVRGGGEPLRVVLTRKPKR